MVTNSSDYNANEQTVQTFLNTYPYRLFWYGGTVLIVYAALRFPMPNFAAEMLVPGTLRYLMQSLPAQVLALTTFAWMNGHVPEKIIGLRLTAVSGLLALIGLIAIASSMHQARPTWAAIGINVMYWGGERVLLRREGRYWRQRRQAQHRWG